LAKSFGLESEKGALIASVEKSSPAEIAGLKAGDVIIEYDGKQISDGNELPRYVAVTPVDKKVRLVIYRDGIKQDVSLVVGTLKDKNAESDQGGGKESGIIGLTVEEISKEMADKLGLRDNKGLVVTDVKPGSAAEELGVTPGSILMEMNGHRLETISEYNATIGRIKNEGVVRLLLRRPDGSVHYVALKVE
jgi:serine protease Do